MPSKVFIQSSNNNTVLSLTDVQGNVFVWSSSGRIGFKGSKRSTAHAAQAAAMDLAIRGKQKGFRRVVVFLKGLGSGRQQAIRGLVKGGLTITALIDTTPFPHNGCQAPKVRRL